MTLDSWRSRAIFLLDPFVRVFQSLNVSANTLTVISLVFAALSGVC